MGAFKQHLVELTKQAIAEDHSDTHYLAHEKTGKEIKVGSTVKGFRGKYHIQGFTPPHHPGSTGRVHTDQGSFFPGVVNAVIKSKHVKEETIDELSKKTLGSYINKSADAAAVAHGKHEVGKAHADEVDRYTNRNGMVGSQHKHNDAMRKAVGADFDTLGKHRLKLIRHLKGIEHATKRLTKEDVVTEGKYSEAAEDLLAHQRAVGQLHRAVKGTSMKPEHKNAILLHLHKAALAISTAHADHFFDRK